MLLSRLTTALLPGLADQPSSIMLFGDSECTISSVETDNILAPYFCNRVSEVVECMSGWESQGINVACLHHWPGTRNIADLSTKGLAPVEDIKQGT